MSNQAKIRDLVPAHETSPWAAFLNARANLILEWRAEGRCFDEIAATLSCDPEQARLIYQTFESKE